MSGPTKEERLEAARAEYFRVNEEAACAYDRVVRRRGGGGGAYDVAIRASGDGVERAFRKIEVEP